MEHKKYKSQAIFQNDYKSFDQFYKDFLDYHGGYHHLASSSDFIYRGCSSNSFELIPSSLRINSRDAFITQSGQINSNSKNLESFQISAEKELLVKFYQKADYCGLTIPDIESLRLHNDNTNCKIPTNNKWISSDFYKLAALAQHYEIPTRLLDWTKDFNVALYFACTGDFSYDNDRIVIWILNSKEILRQKQLDKSSSELDLTPDLFVINPEYYSNPNMCAQKGLFTLWQVEIPELNSRQQVSRKPLDELIDDCFLGKRVNYPILFKITLPKWNSKNVYKFIESIHYDASRLFPGYQGVVKSIKDKGNFARLFSDTKNSKKIIGHSEFVSRVLKFLKKNAILAQENNGIIDASFIKYFGNMYIQHLGYPAEDFDLNHEEVYDHISSLTDDEINLLLNDLNKNIKNNCL